MRYVVHCKMALRRIDYRVHTSELLAMATEHEGERKAYKLSPRERHVFRRWLWWKHGPDCAYCGRVYPFSCMTIDHIQPVSRGGPMRDINNMALSCPGCNRQKGDRWL